MTIYTRKNGEYFELTKDQVRKLRRTSEVIALQVSSRKLLSRTRALAAWLLSIQQRAEKKGTLALSNSDLIVARLPNIDDLLALADEVDAREKELHKC
jgi:hypothetical protein